MANEITFKFTLNVANGVMNYTWPAPTVSIDQSAVGGPNPGTVALTTTEETLAFGDVSSPGICVLQNLSTTATVVLGAATGVYSIELRPQESFCVRLRDSATFYVKTLTGTANLLVLAFED